MALALQAIRIVTMCWTGPGAFCTEMLADLGADVIKAANVNPETLGYLTAMVFTDYPGLRNCRTLGVNLKTEAGKAVFVDLARSADVVMEGFRPGVVKRCLALDFFERHGEQELGRLKRTCEVLDVEGFRDTALLFHPRMTARPLKLPPRQSKHEVACVWEFKVQE
jgi:hypothetical protein